MMSLERVTQAFPRYHLSPVASEDCGALNPEQTTEVQGRWVPAATGVPSFTAKPGSRHTDFQQSLTGAALTLSFSGEPASEMYEV